MSSGFSFDFILFPIYYVLKKNEKIKFFNVHLFNIRLFNRDLNHVLRKSPVNLSLTREEKDRGQSFLRSLGIMKEDKFVCLVNRENNYLKNLKLATFDYKANAFRNTDIESYKLACEEILKKGYYIFRMGRDVTPANINHDKSRKQFKRERNKSRKYGMTIPIVEKLQKAR